ncbi:hypothetical protein SKAU_G00429460 [Synaphobranchus kaupii]|uniref:Uncharacterized protein n=1 Tax=Synaphobranchus kaupii TaxID=118154 RepID=A0A9Q1I9Z7_SYNKA|nr:hypothetical protein SKAU_G00429460 [Synaphobranchus kaupii]
MGQGQPASSWVQFSADPCIQYGNVPHRTALLGRRGVRLTPNTGPSRPRAAPSRALSRTTVRHTPSSGLLLNHYPAASPESDRLLATDARPRKRAVIRDGRQTPQTKPPLTAMGKATASNRPRPSHTHRGIRATGGPCHAELRLRSAGAGDSGTWPDV